LDNLEYSIYVRINKVLQNKGIDWCPKVGDVYAIAGDDQIHVQVAVSVDSADELEESEDWGDEKDFDDSRDAIWIPSLEDQLKLIQFLSKMSMSDIMMNILVVEPVVGFYVHGMLEEDIQLKWLEVRVLSLLIKILEGKI